MGRKRIADDRQTIVVIVPTAIVDQIDTLAERATELEEGPAVTRSEIIRRALDLGVKRLQVRA